MIFFRRGRRLVIALVILMLLLVATVVLAPVVARQLALYYLDEAGLQANIGDVDVNLLKGRLVFSDVTGRSDRGDGFEIARLALSLDYPPLLSRRISVSRLAVNDAAMDIRRGADKTLRVAGIPVAPNRARDSESHDWRLGVQQIRVNGLRIHYRQQANGEQPAIDRELTLDDASARDVMTWQANNDVPLDATIRAGKNRVQIEGHIKPFGPTIGGHLELKTHDFSLGLLAPIGRANGLRHLAGRVEARQQIDIRYDPAAALAVTIDGKTGWRNARLALAGGVDLAGDRLAWQGRLTLRLLRAAGKPARFDSDGQLQFADFSLHEPNNITLDQKNGDWQGKTTTVLAADATRITSDGELNSNGVALTRPGKTRFNADSLHWQGTTQIAVASGPTHVDGKGKLTADGVDFSVPRSLDLDTAMLNWQGTFGVVAGRSTQVDTDGTTRADRLTFAIPGTAIFQAERIDWQGRTTLESAQLLARQGRGRLTATAPRLALPNRPLALSADRLVFDGDYSETPGRDGEALKLRVAGAVDGRRLTVMNTAIKAPWLGMLQVHGDKLNIDGIDSIALADLTAHGVRLLGDTDTDAAVLTSTITKAQQFRLEKRRRYRLADLDIDGANIHLRRNAAGMGVIAKYVGGSENTSQSKSDGASSQAASTYAIDHLALTGPAVAFTDVAVTPHVGLTGSDLNFVLEDLDTERPDDNARYRLALDVGAYGHLDSRGEIAPLAPGGVHMNLDAWLRSLALGPMSGYLDAAMGRRIARGVADGTLHLEATKGQLDGLLDTTLSNFRLAKNAQQKTTVALGLSMDTALKLVRGKADAIHFQTRILGDVTNPYFSIKNLVREAVLAGLRTALTSDYSPLGILNNARKALANLGKSLVSKPVGFEPGRHYVRPEDRAYLGRIAQAMYDKPALTLTVRGQAVPGDADAMSRFQGAKVDPDNRVSLQELAKKRGQAIQDYLAARRVNPDRIELADPVVDHDRKARPEARLTLGDH